MKKRIAVIAVLVLNIVGFQYLKAQNYECTQNGNTYSAMDTYWHYRYRLTNYFMQIGMGNSPANPQPGQSIPAYARNGSSNSSNGCTDVMWWSDQGRNLGYYIGTLATEYYLLRNYNINNPKKPKNNLNETVMELFYAIHAAFRLDSIGITAWIQAGHSVSNTLVGTGTALPIYFPGWGYMIKDDVPSDFLNNNNANPSVAALPDYGGFGQFGSGIVGPVGNVSSELQSHGDNYATVSGTSQDNYFALLMGLTLCVKLLPNDITGFYDANGKYVNFKYTLYGDLQSMAFWEGSTIMQYILNCGFNLTYPDGVTPIPLGAGQDFAYCIPLEAIAVNWFNLPFAAYVTCPVTNPLVWFAYSLPELIGFQIEPCTPPAADIEMGCEMAAMSNSGGLYSGYPNPDRLISGLGYYTYETLESLEGGSCSISQDEGNTFGEDQLFLSVYQILYPNMANFTYINLCNMQDIINSAPYDGPYHHEDADQPSPGNDYPPDYAFCGWASPNRFIWFPPFQSTGIGFSGNFNGLDYMLFFNLYNIVSQEAASEKTVNVPTSCSGAPEYVYYSSNYPYNLYSCSAQGGTSMVGYNTPSTAWDIMSQYCSPIVVSQLDVASNGGLALEGATESYIDLKPTSGNNITIENGGYFDAQCYLSCCAPSNDAYVFQSDLGLIKDRAPTTRIDSTTMNYQMGSEFAPKPNYDAIMSYPNPFSAQTIFEFAVKETTPVTISIYDMKGQKAADVFINQTYNQGNYAQSFDGSNLASGSYIAVMITMDDKKTFKITKN